MPKIRGVVKRHKITTGGQISLPSAVRGRWGTKSVKIEDFGDHVVISPLPDDPIAAARGALKGKLASSSELRAKARQDEAAAEARR
jgi:bifunctional DNA-binding transcriptional regulator/antitoxin component of YhaV-PrlF toxin-antitoxin module